MDYNVKLNLSKLHGVKYFSQDNEQFLAIPVKKNNIFNGKTGFFLELIAYSLKEAKFGESHMIKINYSKDFYQKCTDEQKRRLPIVGSLSELKFEIDKKDAISDVAFEKIPANVEIQEENDLPW